jgi:hypothetical protein
MPQEFEVPPDYVIPSQDFHDAFMEKIRDGNRRCLVLTAPPGTGKSTYLSHVVSECHTLGIPVVRHHYFLSLSDRTVDRSLHLRVAESLMTDLREFYPESLGTLVSTNPNPDHLGQWLNHCGKHFSSMNRSLVVIIDGLDHVLRDKRSLDEVRDLLYHLLPVPPGVTIVLGTQPLEEPSVPKRLLDHAPRDSWEILPCLDRSGVRSWVEKNSEMLGLAETTEVTESTDPNDRSPSQRELLKSQMKQERTEFEIDDLARAFWTVSNGHPLHLRYCLNYLRENGLPATTTTVMELPACSHGDIEQYYRGLLSSLIHERGRQILHLMAACRFDWPEKGIPETMDPGGSQRADFVEALKSIKHLTKETDLGLSAFHSSLLHYIENLDDHGHYRELCIRKTLEWLRSPSAPSHLTWSQEWMLLADLGDTGPLIGGPDRSWAIDSLIMRYHPNETLRILSKSCRAALEKGLLSNYLKTALLRDYVAEIHEVNETALVTVFEAQLILLREDGYLIPRLKRAMPYLSSTELVILARDGAERGDEQLVEDVFDHLNDRTDRPVLSLTSRDFRGPLIRLAAVMKSVDPERVTKYIAKQEEHDVLRVLAEAYSEELRRAKRIDVFSNLLQATSGKDWGKVIVREAALLAMEERIALPLTQGDKRTSDPFWAVWTQLNDTGSDEVHLDFPPLTSRERKRYQGLVAYDSRRKATVAEFREAFFCFLAHHLTGHPNQNGIWLGTIGDHSYEGRFLHKLNEVSRDLATTLRSGVPAGLGFVFERVKDFEKLEPGPDPESWDLFLSVKRAAVQIGLDVTLIGQSLGLRQEISTYEVELAFNSGFCDWDAWAEVYLPLRRRWLSKEAVLWLLSHIGASVQEWIGQFPDRALTFAQMAVLASNHGLLDHAANYVRLTAENLLGYGAHKDILLFEALDAARDCHAAGIEDSVKWIARLAPAIANVKRFTDGDITDYLSERLAEVLAGMDSRLLLRYYEWLLSGEEYYSADKAFGAYLSQADLSSPFDQAAALTAVDTDSVTILAKRAAEGDQDAAEIISSIESYVGNLPVRPEEQRSAGAHTLTRAGGEDHGPEPSGYPPDQFTDYLTACWQQLQVPRRHLRVESWARYWSEHQLPLEAFKALGMALKHRNEFHVSDDLFEIALRHLGADPAFDWLVQAHGRDHGWRRYWREREYSGRRWRIVKERYPERWLEFLQMSVALEDELARAPYGKEKIQRLIQYSISVNQPEMAKVLGEAVTEFTCELVSPLALPRPGWVPEND